MQDSPGQAPSSVEPTPDLWADAPHDLRRAVQDQAPERLSRHGLRDALRFAVLVSADGLAFLFAREVLQFLRQQGPLTAVREIFRAGYLGGFQFAVALLVSLLVVGAYRRGGAWRSPWRLLMGVTLATALALWAAFWTQDVWLVAVQFGATIVSVTLALTVLRGTLAVGVERARERFGVVPKVVLFGDRSSIAQAVQNPVFTEPSGYRVAHELAIDGPEGDGDAIGAELVRVILATQADAVFLTGTLGKNLFQQVIEIAHSTGCELCSLSRAWDLGGVLPSPRIFCGVPVTSLTRPGLKAHQLVIKRLMDLGGSGLGLIVLSPLMVFLAIAVKTTSRGPVLFRQERVGLGGKRFLILKFRSMTEDAESERANVAEASIYSDPRLFKIPDDPRITRLGRWLRRTSLDELPQLLNVLKGDMSLVGPRPPVPEEVALYESRHLCRVDVRPGITGPWQVAGRNLIRDFEQVVLLEKSYIHNWSLWLDLRILLRTVPAVVRGTGAH